MAENQAQEQEDLLEVRLDRLVYGGEAMGRLPDGRAVFVPYTLPGEVAHVRLVEQKRGYARAELIQVLDAAPERITARCAHFTSCGGCHYQHMPYEMQLATKETILRDQLQRIGGLEHPPVQPAVPSPQPWAYRNHLQFHLTDDARLGFHTPRSHQVIPIQECHLPEEPLQALWPRLELEPIPGLKEVDLRLGSGDDVLLILVGDDPEPPEFSVDIPLSAVYLGPGGQKVLSGSAHTVVEVRGRAFQVAAQSFFQVNTPMAGALVEHILANLVLSDDDTLIDLYSGVGLFSAFLAPHVGRLIAVESSPSACDNFVVNLDDFDHVELYQAKAEDVLPILDAQPAVVLVDPPRAGLARPVLDGLLRLGPATLVYVSCDPATLARDAKRLTRGGYRLLQVTPFDLFPQTYHIESISFWEKQGQG